VLLLGVSLNPIAVLLVCQHGNFDVFIGLCVVLGMCALFAWARSGDVVAWLAACLAFGFGAFVKSIPFALAPLLAPGARVSGRLARSLGLALFVGPIVVGVAVIYVLSPHDVSENVLHYRSLTGYFGITGFLHAVGGHAAVHRYERGWPWLALIALLLLFRRFWRVRELGQPQSLLLGALILAAIPALGPGYAPQYIYWFMPLLLVTYVLFDRGWQRILLGGYAVAIATYLVEYAIYPFYGSFLVVLFPGSQTFRHASQTSWFFAGRSWFDPSSRALLDLPIFVAYLVVLFAGWQRLRIEPERDPRPSSRSAGK
jgi:hypothetical protein